MHRHIALISILSFSIFAPSAFASRKPVSVCGVIGSLDGTRFSVTMCLVHTSGTNTFCLRGAHFFAAAVNQETATELNARNGTLACVTGQLAANGDVMTTKVSEDKRCREQPIPNECK
ncbi:MAG: hypothetical protein ACXWQO_08900 [Bdellovibrionota bacterium]